MNDIITGPAKTKIDPLIQFFFCIRGQFFRGIRKSVDFHIVAGQIPE